MYDFPLVCDANTGTVVASSVDIAVLASNAAAYMLRDPYASMQVNIEAENPGMAILTVPCVCHECLLGTDASCGGTHCHITVPTP